MAENDPALVEDADGSEEGLEMDLEKVQNALEEYGDFHKIVLQQIMNLGILDASRVKDVFKLAGAILRFTKAEREEASKMDHVQRVVLKINDCIKPFNMVIKTVSCELNMKKNMKGQFLEQKYLVFLCVSENGVMRTQEMFAQWQVDLYKRCIAAMLTENDNYGLPHNECINMIGDIDPRVGKEKSQQFINRLIDLHYFAKISQGETFGEIGEKDFDVTLGIRTLREFDHLLVKQYSDAIKHCSLCKLILLHGYRCPRCRAAFHRPCYKKADCRVKECKCGCSWPDESTLLIKCRNRDAQDDQINKDIGDEILATSISNMSVNKSTVRKEPVPGSSAYRLSQAAAELENFNNAKKRSPPKRRGRRRRR